MNATQRPEIPVFLLAALAIIGVIVLTLLHDVVPAILNDVIVGTVVGGAAITHPGRAAPPE